MKYVYLLIANNHHKKTETVLRAFSTYDKAISALDSLKKKCTYSGTDHYVDRYDVDLEEDLDHEMV